jgi:hypothetical protein
MPPAQDTALGGRFGRPGGFPARPLNAVLVPLLLGPSSGVPADERPEPVAEDSGRMEPYRTQPVTRPVFVLDRPSALLPRRLVRAGMPAPRADRVGAANHNRVMHQA